MKTPWAQRIPVTALAASMVAALAVGLAGGCTSPEPPPQDRVRTDPARAAARTQSAVAAHYGTIVRSSGGDEHRGQALVQEFQCNRCHEGSGLAAPKFEAQCFGCHQEILDKQPKAAPAVLERWRKRVAHIADTPSLEGIGHKLREEWLERFLTEPHDLRPRLDPTMPRLLLSKAQARDIARYLMRGAPPAPANPLNGGNMTEGRELLTQRGCGTCHVATGLTALPTTPPPSLEAQRLNPAIALAPDLRYVRERLRPDVLVAWIRDPKSVRPGALMPSQTLTEGEAVSIARYLMDAPLEFVSHPTPPRAPAPLERKVTFQEVYEKVLGRTCRHCHEDPAGAGGDGGPGNTGGLGFPGRGIVVSTYEGTLGGFLDAKQERRSLFDPMPDGTPRLVASLLARHAEEVGEINPDLRGMPLGMPALPLEEIQLLTTWVAQGKPR